MYKFIWVNDHGDFDVVSTNKVEIEIQDEATYHEMAEVFERFLKGCGYELGDNHVYIAEDYELEMDDKVLNKVKKTMESFRKVDYID
jgi:hypothetical protein